MISIELLRRFTFFAGLEEKDIDDVVSYIRSLETSEAISDESGNDGAVIVVDSPYDLEETVENLKQAITDQNFTLIRTDHLDHGLVEEESESKDQDPLREILQLVELG